MPDYGFSLTRISKVYFAFSGIFYAEFSLQNIQNTQYFTLDPIKNVFVDLGYSKLSRFKNS